MPFKPIADSTMNYNKNRGLQSDQLLLRAMISFDIFYTHGFHETGSSFVGCPKVVVAVDMSAVESVSMFDQK